MKQFFACLALIPLPLFSVLANPLNNFQFKVEIRTGSDHSIPHFNYDQTPRQQNLMGQVTFIDLSGGKIIIETDNKTSVTVTINDKTVYRRVLPGQTSLENAEQIAVTNISVGDRILIPGGVSSEQTPVRQIIVMARVAIVERQYEEAEIRRARTINGRVTAVNTVNKEIVIQTRRSGAAETITITLAENVKFLRYAPDSLKVNEAVAGTIADVRVGDFVRVVGDRKADGARINAEEVVSGTFMRMVGTLSEINANRNAVIIKNAQTGQLMTVAIGQNTTLRKIPSDVAKILKSRLEGDQKAKPQRGSETANRQQTNQQRGDRGQQPNQNPRQLFENLPVISITDLKKGDAVMIVASTSDKSQMTAVSLITGDGDLQQILLRAQGGGNEASNMSPGLPGNVSGGNAADDDEPQN